MSDAATVESLPTALLLVAPALSLIISYLLFALALRLFGPEQPAPAGAAGSADSEAPAPDRYGPDDREGTPSDASGDLVTCPDCGAENERGYRYCRSCVTELPGSNLPTSSSSTPFLRGIN